MLMSNIDEGILFPEFPPDAFEPFYLPIIPIPLTRTHKATCPKCFCLTSTCNPKKRNIFCKICAIRCITLIQSVVRGFLVRLKIKRLRKKELIYRWFMSRGIDGKHLSYITSLFL